MKKPIIMFLLLIAVKISGQAPNQINYQGIARNSVGNVLPEKPIAVKLSIHDGAATGTVVYSETRNVTTNYYGLFSFAIGGPGASVVTGTIAAINWASGAKFLQVEIDPAGGTNFTSVGTTQLVSVPYAMNAGGASPIGSAGGDLVNTYPNPTVAKIRGTNISSTVPVTNDILGFNGTDWIPRNVSAAGAWSTTGNAGTDYTTNFIGTTDGTRLVFKVNNEISGIITPNSTSFGYQAQMDNVISNHNSAFGVRALQTNIAGLGTGNTAIGNSSMSTNTIGSHNTAAGNFSLNSNSQGSQNIAIGEYALSTNTSGSGNTGIGTAADVVSGNMSNATAIGFFTKVDASNKLRLGNTAVTIIEGQVAYSFPSDGRFKMNINDLNIGLAFITKLKPVTYKFDYAAYSKNLGEQTHFSNEFQDKLQMGFVAQEVEKICIDLGIPTTNFINKPSSDNGTYSIAYSQIVVPLVKAVQEQQAMIDMLLKKVEILENKIHKY